MQEVSLTMQTLTVKALHSFSMLANEELEMVDGGGKKAVILTCAIGGACAGAITGALGGAAVGSAVPVVGTGFGAAIGTLAGATTGFIAGAAAGVSMTSDMPY